MSYEILESLEAVGYDGNLLDDNSFSESINEGFKNDEFRMLITWIVNEISDLGKMDEKISKDSDLNDFLMDLSGFLKELQYTFEAFSGDGNINSRLQTIESRYLLLEFLISELMTQKMLLKISKPKDKKDQNLKIVESPVAIALKDIAITLNLGKPPENISPESLFNKITSQLDETIKAIPDATKRIGKPLFNPKKSLNTDQWNKIAKIQHELDDEYNLRRKMLMTRLDVTIQSFKWSVKEPAKESLINERFSNKLQQIEKIQYGDRRTDVVALIAARDKIAIIEKTSSANVRKNTASKLQRHIIGKVPDRGGRALENQKPPPEMPSWQKRQSGGDNQRGGRGGNQRGGRGGPQNRGGYHQQQQQQKQGFPQDHYQQRQQHNPSNQSYYQQGDNNYQGNDGNFQQQRGGGHHRGGGGGRVQGGWNQGNQRGGHRGGNRGGRW